MKTIIVLITALLLAHTLVVAQDSELNSNLVKERKPFQFTFIYPLGTNGTNSPSYSNDFSLNLLGGVNGGVNACEIGAFANINQGNVFGCQIAGFTNVNIGNATCFQVAGFYNQNKTFSGGQFAGFLNTNLGNSAGMMVAGFANIVHGNTKGWQVAGFVNSNTKETDGAQFAGFANVSKDINGAQLAGFINVAQKVKGVQFGFINVADSVNGVSIGFISIVKKGYNRIELGANESLYGNLTFKIGTEHFYNIFTGGFKQSHFDNYWSYGYGIGSAFSVLPKMSLNMDIMSQQINENHWEIEKINLLNTFRINASFKFAKHLELAAGPTFNVFVSEFDQKEGIGTTSNFVPYCFYNQVYDKYSVQMYVGFNAAVRF